MQRAIVYIDGYNLYYSRLRGTTHKWLDLVALFRDQILRVQLPGVEVVTVKYFTAPAMGKFATHGLVSVTAQNEYHRALKAKYPDLIQIIPGYHVVEEARLMAYQDPPSKENRLSVWRIEEKQTDVNIALTIYRDMARGAADIAVVCSNDSDLVPVAKALREDFPHCQLGIVAPLPEPDGIRFRRANAALQEIADWTRHHIRDDELASAQLPDVVPTRKRAARKPAYW